MAVEIHEPNVTNFYLLSYWLKQKAKRFHEAGMTNCSHAITVKTFHEKLSQLRRFKVLLSPRQKINDSL